MAKLAEKSEPAKKGGLRNMVLLVVVVVMALGGGAALPAFLLKGGHPSAEELAAQANKEPKPALVPFGDAVVVNLAEARLTRYLRVKLMLVVNESKEKQVTDLVAKKKAFLKSWLLGHLSDRSLEEVTGKSGQNRLRREIRDEFNARLFGDGPELVDDVLFEEFVVQ